MNTFRHILNSFKLRLKSFLLLVLLLYHNLCLPKRNFSFSSRFQSFFLIIHIFLTFNFLSCWFLIYFFLLIHSFWNIFSLLIYSFWSLIFLLIHSFWNFFFFFLRGFYD